VSIQVVPWLSPSSLTAFSDCKQQWKWGYADGYRSMGRSSVFDVGSGVHIGLAASYRGEDGPAAFEAWVDAEVAKTERFMEAGGDDIARALESDLESLEETRALGSVMLEQYFSWFVAESFEVLAVERRLERTIPGTDWTLACIIDAVVRDHSRSGRIYVLEHKTFSRFEEWYLYKDQQFVAEAWVAETLVDERVAGVIYNGLRKAFPERTKKDLFERRYIDVNRAQINALLRRLRGMQKQLTSGSLAIYPEPSLAKCRYCQFKEPCDLLLRGDDYQEYLDLMFTKRGDDGR